jgi:hypothetical protein
MCYWLVCYYSHIPSTPLTHSLMYALCVDLIVLCHSCCNHICGTSQCGVDVSCMFGTDCLSGECGTGQLCTARVGESCASVVCLSTASLTCCSSSLICADFSTQKCAIGGRFRSKTFSHYYHYYSVSVPCVLVSKFYSTT